MPSSAGPTPLNLLLLRVLALGGLAISGWLFYLKLTGSITSLAGCGTASGCSNVLGSRWSQWFSIPVSAFSSVMYAALLGLSFRHRGLLMDIIGISLFGGALWFAGLQALVLHDFCPWCMSLHLIGLVCAVLIFQLQSFDSLTGGVIGGVLATLILVIGQVVGPVPQTHQESVIPGVVVTPPTAELPVHERGEGRLVKIGGKSYRLSSLPHLGSPEAPYVIVDYFDYSCDSCLDIGQDLVAMMEKYPEKFCIVVLPCPIDRACNPNIPPQIQSHEHACELARLGLACWRTDPDSFPAVHSALFHRPVLDADAALAAVKPLLGKPLPEDALKDPWIDEMLAAHAEDYRVFTRLSSGQSNYVMPKLILANGRIIHGVPRTREILFNMLEKEFQLTSP